MFRLTDLRLCLMEIVENGEKRTAIAFSRKIPAKALKKRMLESINQRRWATMHWSDGGYTESGDFKFWWETRAILSRGILAHLAKRATRLGSFLLPERHREEILGDIHASIEKAKSEGYGRVAIAILAVFKSAIYVWVVFKLRISDFVSTRSVNK